MLNSSRDKISFILDRATRQETIFHPMLHPESVEGLPPVVIYLCLMCENWSLEFSDEDTELTFDIFLDHTTECVVGAQEWEPTRWRRVLDADGGMWMESSDEDECRRELRGKKGKTRTLQQLFQTKAQHEWRDI